MMERLIQSEDADMCILPLGFSLSLRKSSIAFTSLQNTTQVSGRVCKHTHTHTLMVFQGVRHWLTPVCWETSHVYDLSDYSNTSEEEQINGFDKVSGVHDMESLKDIEEFII